MVTNFILFILLEIWCLQYIVPLSFSCRTSSQSCWSGITRQLNQSRCELEDNSFLSHLLIHFMLFLIIRMKMILCSILTSEKMPLRSVYLLFKHLLAPLFVDIKLARVLACWITSLGSVDSSANLMPIIEKSVNLMILRFLSWNWECSSENNLRLNLLSSNERNYLCMCFQY